MQTQQKLLPNILPHICPFAWNRRRHPSAYLLQALPNISVSATPSAVINSLLEMEAFHDPPAIFHWEQWLEYFETSDAAAERKEELQIELKAAVLQESYSRAARLKAELNLLEARDAVAAVEEQLQAALVGEHYEEAAILRDEGLTGLAGWWAGKAEDDPIGHLLHISREYNRWTGRVFRPRDIAEMKLNKPQPFLGRSLPQRPLPRSSSQTSAGSPIFEVFLRPSDQLDNHSSEPGVEGAKVQSGGKRPRYVHQAVSLRLPTMSEMERRRPPPSSSTFPSISADGNGAFSSPLMDPMVRVDDSGDESASASTSVDDQESSAGGDAFHIGVLIKSDGTVSLRPLPASPSLSSSSTTASMAGGFEGPAVGAEGGQPPAVKEAEEQAVMQTLRWPSSSSSSSASGPRDSDNVLPTGPVFPSLAAESSSTSLSYHGEEDIIDLQSQNDAMSSSDQGDTGVTLYNQGVGLTDSNFRNGALRGSTSDGGGGMMSLPYDDSEDGKMPFAAPLSPSSSSSPSSSTLLTGDMLFSELLRAPARIELSGRDKMVFMIPDSSLGLPPRQLQRHQQQPQGGGLPGRRPFNGTRGQGGSGTFDRSSYTPSPSSSPSSGIASTEGSTWWGGASASPASSSRAAESPFHAPSFPADTSFFSDPSSTSSAVAGPSASSPANDDGKGRGGPACEDGSFEIIIPIPSRLPLYTSPTKPKFGFFGGGGLASGARGAAGGGRSQPGSGTLNHRMTRAIQQQASSSSSSGEREGPVEEVLKAISDQVAESLASKAGWEAPPRDAITLAVTEMMSRVASGEPIESVNVQVPLPFGLAPPTSFPLQASTKDVISTPSYQSSAPPTLPPLTGPLKSQSLSNVAFAVKEEEEEEVTSVTYKRLQGAVDTTAKTGDPLSGLYLGSFGPHGPELLRLDRSIIDGEEVVQATKLTGDANVPAGSISFRAKCKQRLEVRDVYPDELGIAARYKGEGRVAQKGFTQPRWVEGELLVFTTKGNPVTAGAELGFVWSVPGEKRFLILLNRIDLSRTAGAIRG